MVGSRGWRYAGDGSGKFRMGKGGCAAALPKNAGPLSFTAVACCAVLWKLDMVFEILIRSFPNRLNDNPRSYRRN